MKTSENRKVFCFQEVEKGCIWNKWVNIPREHYSGNNIVNKVKYFQSVQNITPSISSQRIEKCG